MLWFAICKDLAGRDISNGELKSDLAGSGVVAPRRLRPYLGPVRRNEWVVGKSNSPLLGTAQVSNHLPYLLREGLDCNPALDMHRILVAYSAKFST